MVLWSAIACLGILSLYFVRRCCKIRSTVLSLPTCGAVLLDTGAQRLCVPSIVMSYGQKSCAGQADTNCRHSALEDASSGVQSVKWHNSEPSGLAESGLAEDGTVVQKAFSKIS